MLTLGSMLTACATRFPARDAVICGTRHATFAELESRANRLANALRGRGMRTGDRVALHLPNSIAVIETMAAILKAGGIIVPISTRLALPEIRYMLTDAAPFAIVYTPELRDAVRHAADGVTDLRFLVAGDATAGETGLDDLIAGASDQPPDLAPFFPDDAVIGYTSGTTGRPKGALSTHRNLVVGQGWFIGMEFGHTMEDRLLCATPMAHRTGIARAAVSFCVGCTLIVQEKFDPAETIRLIETQRATHIGVVPTIARMLLPEIEKRPAACASLKAMLATGEVFPVAVKEGLFAALPALRLHSYYAQTEAGMISHLRPEQQRTHPASMGQPIPGVEVRIVDEDLSDVAAGEPGEVLARAGAPGEFMLMREYFNRPEDTAATILDGDWLRTGDMARIGVDGHLYFVDRVKDMIVSGGLNIYSKEVEDALATHPAVAEAAVVGVPDAEFGEAVMAFIVPKAGEAPTAEALIDHCRPLIAGYKKPRHVRIVDTLPRNSANKVAKHALREMGQSARMTAGR